MELDDFVAKYPKVTRKQICQICNVSLYTANRWFMAKDKRIEPAEDQKLRLDLFDYLYQRKQTEPKVFEDLQEIIKQIPK